MSNSMIRYLAGALALCLLGGVAGQARGGTKVTVFYSGASSGCAVNGFFDYLQSHTEQPPPPDGDFDFSMSADAHFLNYTITQPSAPTVNTQGNHFVINTIAAPTPNTFQLDVTTGTTKIEIVLKTLTALSPTSLPLCSAFLSMSSPTAASGTFKKFVNGAQTFTCPITVTKCAQTTLLGIIIPETVVCPVYDCYPQPAYFSPRVVIRRSCGICCW